MKAQAAFLELVLEQGGERLKSRQNNALRILGVESQELDRKRSAQCRGKTPRRMVPSIQNYFAQQIGSACGHS